MRTIRSPGHMFDNQTWVERKIVPFYTTPLTPHARPPTLRPSKTGQPARNPRSNPMARRDNTPEETAPDASAPTNGAAHATAPSGTITVQGMTVPVPRPYGEGHVLTAGEASHLNQVLSENLRNNFAAKVKKFRKEQGLAEDAQLTSEQQDQLRSAFSEYSTSYKLEARAPGSPRGSSDPVERTTHTIAAGIVREHLKKTGYTAEQLKTFNTDGTIERLVAQLIAKRPDIKDEAQRRVQSTQALASEAIDLGVAA